MKQIARKIIGTILGWQVRRLRAMHSFKIVGVVGSIGKTSTKLAIAQTLGHKYRVRYQSGNYNDLVSVPLVFFGQTMPALFNPFAWLKLLFQNELLLRKAYPYDVVVVELGTDGPGQIASFHAYLQLNIAVVTAITPEHMEFFDDINAVAREELSVSSYAETMVVNADFVDIDHRALLPATRTYSISQTADYEARAITYTSAGIDFNVAYTNEPSESQVSIRAFSEAHIHSALAAAAVARMCGFLADEIPEALSRITPVAGRMQMLAGIKNSKIIDDTYNASPEATRDALNTMYRIEAPQKIVLLGNMNELGTFSEQAHQEIGDYCDSNQLDEVITLGPDANKFLAPAAIKNGCKVTTCTSPYEAGNYIASILSDGALVLAKGSQNGVFAEEALKPLLADITNTELLVRQTPYWLGVKSSQFPDAER